MDQSRKLIGVNEFSCPAVPGILPPRRGRHLQIRGKCILPEINRRRVIELFVKAGGTIIAKPAVAKPMAVTRLNCKQARQPGVIFCVDPWQPGDTSTQVSHYGA